MLVRDKPLAITMGDPSGVGPEIIVSSLEKKEANFKAVVIADSSSFDAVITCANKLIKSKMTKIT